MSIWLWLFVTLIAIGILFGFVSVATATDHIATDITISAEERRLAIDRLCMWVGNQGVFQSALTLILLVVVVVALIVFIQLAPLVTGAVSQWLAVHGANTLRGTLLKVLPKA